MKKIDDIYFENPEKYIPVGSYCRGCVFIDKDITKPIQMNGYCHYLKKGDWDINKESKIIDVKTNKEVSYEERQQIPLSLLWDGFKECGIKNYQEWCIDCEYVGDIVGYNSECKFHNNMIEDVQSKCDDFKPSKEF